MRAATRLLASSAKFLEPGAPTGLTGLFTHAAPRSTLLYLYSSTLETLRTKFPESSVYRQSTEALTRHRMSIIESTRPAGLEEWQERVKSAVESNPLAFKKIPAIGESGKKGEFNIVYADHATEGLKTQEWNEDYVQPPMLEGIRYEDERADMKSLLQRDPVEERAQIPRIEPEPPLSAAQIEEVEGAIGAGLIEEVIAVAEGERSLAERLAENKVWEELEEAPKPGQWTYFERGTHTPQTQAR